MRLKLRCPHCTNLIESKVIETRAYGRPPYIRRRRSCLQCAGRFSTVERVVGEKRVNVLALRDLIDGACDAVAALKSRADALDAEPAGGKGGAEWLGADADSTQTGCRGVTTMATTGCPAR